MSGLQVLKLILAVQAIQACPDEELRKESTATLLDSSDFQELVTKATDGFIEKLEEAKNYLGDTVIF